MLHFPHDVAGTLVISAYVGCPDITLTVTPDLKCPDGKGMYSLVLTASLLPASVFVVATSADHGQSAH